MAQKVQKASKFETYFLKQKEKKYRNSGSQCGVSSKSIGTQSTIQAKLSDTCTQTCDLEEKNEEKNHLDS
jgi:hypothetical protein